MPSGLHTEKTELLDLQSGSCLTDFLAFLIANTVGGLISTNKVLLCDIFCQQPCDKCVILDTSNYLTPSKTVIPCPLCSRRYLAGSIIMENQEGKSELWITGGWNKKNGGGLEMFQTTILVSETEARPGEALPFKVYGHCLVKINSTTIVMLGGFKPGGVDGACSKETWYFHVMESQWKSGPDMNTPRYNHACDIFDFNGDQYIIVTGGEEKVRGGLTTTNEATLTSTEFLLQDSTTWKEGKDGKM